MISAVGEVEEGLPKTGIFHNQLHGLRWVKLGNYYQRTTYTAHLLLLRRAKLIID